MAIGPIDYTMQGVQAPGTAFLQAAQVGANVAQVQAQREAMRAKADEALREQQRQDMINRRIAEIRAKPNRTIDDYAEVAPYMNQAQLSFLTQQFKSQSEVKQQNDLLFLGETLSALRAKKPEVAIARLRTQADAEEATNPQAAKAYRDGALLAESDPASAELIVGPLLYRLPGADKVLENIKKTEGAAPGRTISTSADKIAAGLVDDQGKPLLGTFFEQPGKKPELVEGAKPKAGFQILTPENARARGLPTQGFTWQINETTGEISSLVKPPQAAVQVNMPGQPTPPTKLEEEIDKKFAPLAVEWMAGEKTQAAARINQLTAVAKTLEKKGQRITGPVVGLTPNVVLAFINPTSREARANAERILQEGLRATLGAQFTKVEGENYLARAYDPLAKPEDNLRRLNAIITQMRESAKDRDAMLKYIQGPGKGSLKGYTGRIPSIQDFYAAIEEPQAPQAPGAAPTPQEVDAALRKYLPTRGGQ